MSRRSIPARPHLSTILSLHPDTEHCCAGIALSKGRRCQLRTSAVGRKLAILLLNTASDALHAGRAIDDALLRTLASCVLCSRWHQGQATGLVETWKRSIDEFRAGAQVRDDGTLSAAATRPGGDAPGRDARTLDVFERILSEHLEVFFRTMGERDGWRERRVIEQPDHRQPEGIDNGPTEPTAGSGLDQPSSQVTAGNPTSYIVLPEGAVRVVGRDLGVGINVTVEIHPRAGPGLGGQLSPQEEEIVEVVGERPVNIPTQPTAINNGTQRQTVDGDCSICLESLQPAGMRNPRLDTDNAEDAYPLSWCRGQCGVNFHSSCINEWLANSTTCPNCRAIWEE
ncbi:hypothetical protein BJX64DRAFT_267010 [Aspergillus heterothallicus]